MREYSNGNLVSRQGSIATTSASTLMFTAATLADITYLNREDKIPVYMTQGRTQFVSLPNLVAHWRAASVRVYWDFLWALITTEGGIGDKVSYSRIRPAHSGAVPSATHSGV